MAQISRTVLHNTTGGHNKFYEVSIQLNEDKKVSYSLIARWGRIENFKSGKPSIETKATNKDLIEIELEASSLVQAKIKRGYKLFLKEQGGILSSPKVTKKPAKKEEHIPEWWESPEYTITDREI